VPDGGVVRGAVAFVERFGVPSVSWSDGWDQPLLAAGAARGARVLLHGEGGDELVNPRVHLLSDLLRHGQLRRAWRLAAQAVGRQRSPVTARILVQHGARGLLPARAQTAIDVAADVVRRASPWLGRRDVLQLAVARGEQWAWRDDPAPAAWASTAHGVTTTVEALGVTDHLRRRAVWSGMRSRSPLLAADALELALAVDPAATFGPGIDRRPLRDAMAGLVPDEVRLRRGKALFDPWVVASMELDRAWARALLLGPGAQLPDLLGRRGVEQAVDRPFAAYPVSALWGARGLLRLTSVEAWLRHEVGTLAEVSLGELSSPSPVIAAL
jgi:hypothetical protein